MFASGHSGAPPGGRRGGGGRTAHRVATSQYSHPRVCGLPDGRERSREAYGVLAKLRVRAPGPRLHRISRTSSMAPGRRVMAFEALPTVAGSHRQDERTRTVGPHGAGRGPCSAPAPAPTSCPPTANPRARWLRSRSDAATSGAHHLVCRTVAHLALRGASSGRTGVVGPGECGDEAVVAGEKCSALHFCGRVFGASPDLVASPRDFMDWPGVDARLGPTEGPADPRRTNRTIRGSRAGQGLCGLCDYRGASLAWDREEPGGPASVGRQGWFDCAGRSPETPPG
jgi:hypothetical protein